MIVRANITEEIVAYFKEKINSGEWKVGEKIPSENQLTEMLGVSRASVRTAVQHLVGLGVLESRHGKGTYLLDDQVDESTGSEMRVTAEDCRDIYKVLEFRRIVESEGAYLAAQHMTPEHIRELKQSLAEMKKNKGKREQFVSADTRFHEIIAHATGNPILEKSTVKVFRETRRNHEQMNHIFGYEDGLHYHALLIKAFEKGDAEEARRCMYEHMQHALNKMGED